MLRRNRSSAAVVAFHGNVDSNKKMPVAVEKTIAPTESQKIVQVADKKATKQTKEGITVHFQWDSKKGEFPHLYYTNVNGKENTKTTSPGVPMHDDGDGWYSYTIPDAKSADVQVSVPEYGYQTTLQNKTGEDWWLSQGNWYQENPVSETKDKKQEVATQEKEVEVKKDAKKVATDSKITVHCYSEKSTPKVYYWNALPEDKETDWPGEEMKAEEDGWYSYTFDSTSKINVLFLVDEQQSDDFCANKAGDWYFDGSKWSQKENSPTKEPTKTEGPVVTAGPKPTKDPNVKVTHNDFREESIYFVMTARFYDGDKSNNIHCDHDQEVGNGDSDPAWRGDFKGLIEKLDYIKALGFSAIWITPAEVDEQEPVLLVDLGIVEVVRPLFLRRICRQRRVVILEDDIRLDAGLVVEVFQPFLDRPCIAEHADLVSHAFVVIRRHAGELFAHDRAATLVGEHTDE
ncbi:MAG: starch-binding protein, partial [Lachnospiraceae bacterium]|nr:starch-binding protein [Lachnospiraceae bacterium]